MAVPRGNISNSLSTDLRNLLRALTCDLRDQEKVDKFEKKFSEYMGASYCVSFNLARTAIYFALKNQNFPKGSRILLPPLTIKGILDVVLELGFVPVFVDLDRQNVCFNTSDLEEKINKSKPVAAIVTYLFGVVPDVLGIIDVLKKNGVYIIEDFSQTLNGKFGNKKVGTFGDCGVYSASSTKTFDIYGGGLLITNDAKTYSNLKLNQRELNAPKRTYLIRKILRNLILNMITNRFFFNVVTFNVLRIVSLLKPELIERFVGARDKSPIEKLPSRWFVRFSSFQAEFASKALNSVHSKDLQRTRNYQKIAEASDWQHFRGDKGGTSVHWQNLIIVDDANDAMRIFRSLGIDTARTSLVLISDLPKYNIRESMPIAEALYNKGIYLPCYAKLTDTDIDRINGALKVVFRSSIKKSRS